MTALWIGFLVLVAACLALDLGVFHRRGHADVSLKESLGWSLLWIAMGLGFAGVIYVIYEGGFAGAILHQDGHTSEHSGGEAALLYLTAYVLEKSLSIDNLFVIAIVFRNFRIAREHQHRVLFWGIIGALVMRGVMIGGGLFLVSRFAWLFYVFGAYLIYQGAKLLWEKHDEEAEPGGAMMRVLKKFIPIAPNASGERFLTVVDGKRFATPALFALIMVEITDVMFAVDSVPAVLAVATEPYIVYTSNIFAILGLRALYSVLADLMDRFEYLQFALAAILVFVGVKLCLHDFVHIPSYVTLSIIIGCMTLGVSWSWIRSAKGASASN